MKKHYRREDLGEGVRGKHHSAYMRGTKTKHAQENNLAEISPQRKVIVDQQRVLPLNLKPNAETVAAMREARLIRRAR